MGKTLGEAAREFAFNPGELRDDHGKWRPFEKVARALGEADRSTAAPAGGIKGKGAAERIRATAEKHGLRIEKRSSTQDPLGHVAYDVNDANGQRLLHVSSSRLSHVDPRHATHVTGPGGHALSEDEAHGLLNDAGQRIAARRDAADRADDAARSRPGYKSPMEKFDAADKAMDDVRNKRTLAEQAAYDKKMREDADRWAEQALKKKPRR